MTVAGNIYGVVLNDLNERKLLANAFDEKPYLAPPKAPVVYMKPLSSLASGPIIVPPSGGLFASTTIAVLIARDTGGATPNIIASCIGGVALALDLALPATSYYRPAIAQKNGDGRLAIGKFVAPPLPGSIRLLADGKTIHQWSLERMARPIEALILDLADFMTLKAGDVLLVGLPGDAPTVSANVSLQVEADGLPTLDVTTIGGTQ